MRVSGGGPIASNMEQRRNPAVHCTRWVSFRIPHGPPDLLQSTNTDPQRNRTQLPGSGTGTIEPLSSTAGESEVSRNSPRPASKSEKMPGDDAKVPVYS